MMQPTHDILNILAPVLAGLDPQGRFNAMKAMPAGTTRYPWLIPAMVAGLIAVAVVVAVVVVCRRRGVQRREKEEFTRRAERAGLTVNETELLWAIARSGGGDMPRAIITNRSFFEESTSRFLSSKTFRAAPVGRQGQMRALISAVGDTLGFSPARDQASGTVLLVANGAATVAKG